MSKREDAALTTRYAGMLSAMGTEPRLRIMRLLLSAHPEGMIAGDIGAELEIPPLRCRITSTSSRMKTS